MTIDLIRALYAYSDWANQRLLETALALPPDQLFSSDGPDSSSVRDTLVHIMSAQQVWLARMQDGATPAALDPHDFPDIPRIHARWAAINQATQQLLDRLDGDALEQAHTYTNDRGEQNTYQLWQMLLHQANHAMQHRSEAALLLTTAGHSPGWLDFLYYLDWRHRT
jgi:uncharacterized damage-inducible protein DinB